MSEKDPFIQFREPVKGDDNISMFAGMLSPVQRARLSKPSESLLPSLHDSFAKEHPELTRDIFRAGVKEAFAEGRRVLFRTVECFGDACFTEVSVVVGPGEGVWQIDGNCVTRTFVPRVDAQAFVDAGFELLPELDFLGSGFPPERVFRRGFNLGDVTYQEDLMVPYFEGEFGFTELQAAAENSNNLLQAIGIGLSGMLPGADKLAEGLVSKVEEDSAGMNMATKMLSDFFEGAAVYQAILADIRHDDEAEESVGLVNDGDDIAGMDQFFDAYVEIQGRTRDIALAILDALNLSELDGASDAVSIVLKTRKRGESVAMDACSKVALKPLAAANQFPLKRLAPRVLGNRGLDVGEILAKLLSRGGL